MPIGTRVLAEENQPAGLGGQAGAVPCAANGPPGPSRGSEMSLGLSCLELWAHSQLLTPNLGSRSALTEVMAAAGRGVVRGEAVTQRALQDSARLVLRTLQSRILYCEAHFPDEAIEAQGDALTFTCR